LLYRTVASPLGVPMSGLLRLRFWRADIDQEGN
jgi:hypothetical protein